MLLNSSSSSSSPYSRLGLRAVCVSLSRARSVLKVKEKQNTEEKLVLDMCALSSLSSKKKRSRLLLDDDDTTFRIRRNVKCACRSIDRVVSRFKNSSVCVFAFFSARTHKKKEKFLFVFGGAREPNAHKEALNAHIKGERASVSEREIYKNAQCRARRTTGSATKRTTTENTNRNTRRNCTR